MWREGEEERGRDGGREGGWMERRREGGYNSGTVCDNTCVTLQHISVLTVVISNSSGHTLSEVGHENEENSIHCHSQPRPLSGLDLGGREGGREGGRK